MIEIKHKYTGDIVQTFPGGGRTLSHVKFDKNKDFTYVDFENLELLNCDFSEVDLTAVEFKHCFISECSFSKSILKNSEFNFCELSFCTFDYSILDESYFCHCEIKSSDFSHSRMEDNIIEMSYLSEVSFDGIDSDSFEICYTMLDEVSFVEGGGKLDIEFGGCSLQNVGFDKSGYSKCKFSNCIFDYIYIDGNIVGNNIGTKTIQSPLISTNNSCNMCTHYSLFTTRCIKHQKSCLPSNCCEDFEE